MRAPFLLFSMLLLAQAPASANPTENAIQDMCGGKNEYYCEYLAAYSMQVMLCNFWEKGDVSDKKYKQLSTDTYKTLSEGNPGMAEGFRNAQAECFRRLGKESSTSSEDQSGEEFPSPFQ